MSALDCRLLIDAPRSGAWNMAVDEALLDAAGRTQACCLRFYQWETPTLSLGYFQRHNEREAHPPSRSCPVVRRSTGGGAIVHDRELTYSLTIGAEHPLCADPTTLYRRVHGSLVATLRALGADAELCQPARRLPAADEPFLCFQRRAEGDLVCGPAKICGSAQRRHKGAILQHGSILLAQSACAPQLPGLAEIAGLRLSPDELLRAWLPALCTTLNIATTSDELSSAEKSAAERIVAEKHGHADWIERR